MNPGDNLQSIQSCLVKIYFFFAKGNFDSPSLHSPLILVLTVTTKRWSAKKGFSKGSFFFLLERYRHHKTTCTWKRSYGLTIFASHSSCVEEMQKYYLAAGSRKPPTNQTTHSKLLEIQSFENNPRGSQDVGKGRKTVSSLLQWEIISSSDFWGRKLIFGKGFHTVISCHAS